MNVSEVLVEFSVRLGAGAAFTLTGGMAMHVNKAVHDNPGLRAVYCHHESACVSAAEGYSKATGFARPGLAVVTSGPGVSNSLTGILSAFGDSVPLIVLAGQIKSADINAFGVRTHGAQEIDSRSIVSPAVKTFVRVSVASLRRDLAVATRALFTGRPGPVFLEVPLDVQPVDVADAEEILESCDVVRAECAQERRMTPESRSAWDGAREKLEKSRRPIVLIGNGCRVAQADVPSLIESLQSQGVPRLYTWQSFDLEPAAHPLNLGCPGALAPINANKALQEADLLLSIGARLDLLTTAFQPEHFGAVSQRIIIDADPAELAKLASPNSTCVHADAAEVVAELIHAPPFSHVDPHWTSGIRTAKDDYLAEENQRLATEGLTVRFVSTLLSRAARDTLIASASSGLAIETFIRFFRPQDGTRIFHGGALGSMGLGLSSGIGAAVAAPNRRTWTVEGDGGLWMNVQELATMKTVAPENLTLMVLNNGGYASIAQSQQRALGYEAGARPSSGLDIPSLEHVAAAVGLPYRAATTCEQAGAAIAEITSEAHRGPAIVEFFVTPTEPLGPRLVTVVTESGPRTAPLEDISW